MRDKNKIDIFQVYKSNTLHTQRQGIMQAFPRHFDAANEFINTVEALTQTEDYDLNTSDLPRICWVAGDMDDHWDVAAGIANALPIVMVNRVVSQEVEWALAYIAEDYWNDDEYGEHRLDIEIEKIMQIKIKLQRCAKRFLQRILQRKRNLAIAMALHPRLGDECILSKVLNEDIIRMCLI